MFLLGCLESKKNCKTGTGFEGERNVNILHRREQHFVEVHSTAVSLPTKSDVLQSRKWMPSSRALAWAVGRNSSGPPAAGTVGTKSTGGFYRADGSPCTLQLSRRFQVCVLLPGRHRGREVVGVQLQTEEEEEEVAVESNCDGHIA